MSSTQPSGLCNFFLFLLLFKSFLLWWYQNQRVVDSHNTTYQVLLAWSLPLLSRPTLLIAFFSTYASTTFRKVLLPLANIKVEFGHTLSPLVLWQMPRCACRIWRELASMSVELCGEYWDFWSSVVRTRIIGLPKSSTNHPECSNPLE